MAYVTLPSGLQYEFDPDEIKRVDPDAYNKLLEAMITSSKLYTPPPKEYEEPTEDLYDWDTGKVRD